MLRFGGFTLPHPPRDQRRLASPDAPIRWFADEVEPVSPPEGRLLLQTIPSRDINLDCRNNDGGRRVVLVNPDDLDTLALRDGDVVDLVSEWTDGDRRAPEFRVVSYPTARGCAAAYFPATNVLVPFDGSNIPTGEPLVVRLEPR